MAARPAPRRLPAASLSPPLPPLPPPAAPWTRETRASGHVCVALGPGLLLFPGRCLLDRDGGASALQGGPPLVRALLVDLLQHRLGRGVHQVLGLLEAEAGQAAHLLDDLDLLVARGLEDDVELVLLLLGRGLADAAARRSRDRGHRGSRLDVERVLELLHELGQLEEGHLLERVEQVVSAELRHDCWVPFPSVCLCCLVWPADYSALASAVAPSVLGSSVLGAASAAPPSASRLARSASASWAICTGSAFITAAALDIEAFISPASLASSTSRGSRSASRSISAGEIALPSSTPPLITSSGLAREKSRSPLAASTTSPLTNAIADGPLSRSPSWLATPASFAAILVSVFFTTVKVALSPSEPRSSASWATVRPRYSVSTAPSELWNRSASSATAVTLSALAMVLLSSSVAGQEGARDAERPGAGTRAWTSST